VTLPALLAFGARPSLLACSATSVRTASWFAASRSYLNGDVFSVNVDRRGAGLAEALRERAAGRMTGVIRLVPVVPMHDAIASFAGRRYGMSGRARRSADSSGNNKLG
jgi:hypothetical protein